MKSKSTFRKPIAWLLTLAMIFSMLPVSVFATEDIEIDVAETSTEVVCDCGTDDALIHATTCAVYVAPENPVCYCTEKCTETNIWCDVCGFDYTACTGTDTAAVYTEGAVASVTTIGGTTTYYETLPKAVTAAQGKSKSTLTLLKNIDLGSEGLVITSGTFTIDLNDCTYTSTAFQAIEIEGASVTITDKGPNKTGSINGGSCGVDVRSGGTLNITGGTITAVTGIYSYIQGTINISGGTVIGTGKYTFSDAGVKIYTSNSVCNITGGTIISTQGYGVYSNSGTLNISGNTNISGTSGYGVYGSGTIDISGGNISGGVAINGGTTTISGGSISGGTADLYVEGSKGILKLTFDEGKTVGATFPGGITFNTKDASVSTLAELLVDTATYWGVVDGKDTMLTVADDATSITDKGDITIRAICDHSGNTAPAVDTTNGTHSFTCTVCGGTVTEDHVSEKEENKATCKKLAVCDTCGASYGELADHTGGTATCTTQAVCEVCGESYGDLNPDNHEYEKNNGICCETYQPATLNENTESAYYGYYEISNAGQLFWYANYVNTVDRTASAVLTADIDLENRPWTPIGFTGENNHNFRGVFDGQNHTIKGLYVEGGRAGLGFFGEVRTGTVKNFTIYGEVVVNTEVDYVGGVIGSICGLNGENDLYRNGAIIQNITSYVNLTAKAHGIGMIGGFVGYANHESLIENCSWYGTFDAGIYRVDSGAGGFIGKIQENTSEVTIRNCAAYGTIKTNYEKNSYNNTATIYMGGFLSFSNTGAKTVLENCLFAGKFERGENLTEQAFLGAFGTLRSVNAIKNCYYLGDDGLGAVHSDSPLKAGADNVEITNATANQLVSGEVAYLLQSEQIEEKWGQQIGVDAYPVLGGAKVLLADGVYYNELSEFAILSNGTEGNKATATVAIPTAGTYTLIFADYEETRLNNMDLVTVTTESDNAVVNVPSEIDITLGTDDKIMLWKDMTTLVPLCEAYIVK